MRLALLPLLLSAGCLPFFGGKGDPPRTSLAIQRFAAATSQLGVPPSPPTLPEVTRMLADAIESLPRARDAHGRAQEILAHAGAMQGAGNDGKQAQLSIDAALQVLQHMKKPAGSNKDRERALKAVGEAVGLHDRYRALARALLLFSGGQPGLPAGATLRAIVGRLSVENDDIARRTVAQALVAIADELRALGVDPGDLSQRATRLTSAEPLAYSPALRDALDRVAAALRDHRDAAPAFATLAGDARDAVERVTRDRPFELQRPATQDALRLISDCLVVASPTRKSGR